MKRMIAKLKIIIVIRVFFYQISRREWQTILKIIKVTLYIKYQKYFYSKKKSR